jgi:hypothetical protein
MIERSTFRPFLPNQVEPPKISFNGLVFKEFTNIGKQKADERSHERRAQRKKELEAHNQYHPQEEDGYDDDDDDDDGGGFDFGGGGDDYNDGDNNDAGNAGFTSLDEAFQLLEDSDHGLCAVHDLLIVIFITTFNLTKFCSSDASNIGKFFEGLCRAHIQAFAKGAEEFAFNTHLSARVIKWKAKLIPILELVEP